MSLLTTLTDSGNAISSQESEDGPLPSSLPELSISAVPGAEAAHVNRTRRPGKAKGKRTRDTSGPSGSLSSGNASLNTCLANRCQQLLGMGGSMEYSQTWKERATPGGQSYWEHTASGHRTSGSECSGDLSETAGYPTPQAHDTQEQGKGRQIVNGRIQTHSGDSVSVNLRGLVAGYPTPTSLSFANSHQPGNNRYMNTIVGYGTPRVTTNNGHGNSDRSSAARLEDQVAGYNMPAGINPDGSERTRNDQLPRQIHGLITPSEHSETARLGVLDAAFSRWLMGFPEAWDKASPNYESYAALQARIVQAD